MTPLQSAILGLAFWIVSVVQVVLMAWLWKYNDPGKYTGVNEVDEADPWRTTLRKWVILHRIAGLVYAAIYIFMMSAMVPRLWAYQVELPARTVAHLMIGFSIGIVLVSKIAVIRFFRHLSPILPVFGFLLFLFTTVLLGLSVPFAYQEQRLMTTSRAFSRANMVRVERLLPRGGYSGEEASRLARADVLERGRRILLKKCVQCHDLRTVLSRPRTPRGWVTVIHRMAAMPTIGLPIVEEDRDPVTAYLVAITPDLQQSVKEKRIFLTDAASPAIALAPRLSDVPGLDMNRAAQLLEETCTQCHELTELDNHGGDTMDGWLVTVTRMVEQNGLVEETGILETIILYLTVTRPVEASLGLTLTHRR